MSQKEATSSGFAHLKAPSVNSRQTPPAAPAKLTEFPCFAYDQKTKETPARVVNSIAEAKALGPNWGPFPWTDQVIDRSHPDSEITTPGIDEPQGDEYPKFVYHQRASNAPPKRVNDPDEEAAAVDYGPLPFSEERFAALLAKDAAAKAAGDAASAQAAADAKAAADAAAKVTADAAAKVAADAAAKTADAKAAADAAKAVKPAGK